MATFDASAINKEFSEIFTNGRGEAGLEVGTDPGLPPDQYVRIPQCMVKRWAAKMSRSGYEAITTELERVDIAAWTATSTPASMAGKPGWVVSGDIIITEGRMWFRAPNRIVHLEEFHMDPVSADDVRAFVMVNRGHIKDEAFDDETQKWIHATRFWAAVAGFVATTKSREHVVVPTPAVLDDGLDDIVRFISGYSANAWTASAARAASWRKTNHATGGDALAGFPRRWAQKMGYIRQVADKAQMRSHVRAITDAFYIATHASSVHAVLALQVPDDKNHWASINPSYGLIPTWDIGHSAKIRMRPNTQVAGTAIVVDSVVVLKMAIKEGIAPFISSIDQAQALVDAFKRVEREGIQCATYAKWFLDGHPRAVAPSEFNQKDATYADLAGELAIIATKYYAGSTISDSAALNNAANQLGSEDSKATWSALAAHRRKISGEQIVRATRRIKGASAAGIVSDILAEDEDDVREGVEEFNKTLTDLATMVGGITAPHIDDDAVVASMKATATAAEE